MNHSIKITFNILLVLLLGCMHPLNLFAAYNPAPKLRLFSEQGKYYLEIPSSFLGRDILIISRIKTTSAQTKTYAGDQIGSHVIRLVKQQDGSIAMTEVSYGERATGGSPLAQGLAAASRQPILAVFSPLPVNEDSSIFRIDISEYLQKDNNIFFFDERSRRTLFIGRQNEDLSKIDSFVNHDDYISVVSTKTFSRTLPPQAEKILASSSSFTLSVNTNIIPLDQLPMVGRVYDPRVGYISNNSYIEFNKGERAAENRQLISRWKLQPKKADQRRYLRGQLVEPERPIVFYIDPATPKQWIPYLIMGVEDWQTAFEQAGFKKAILAMEIPNGAGWGVDDSKHSFIVYKPSDITNANGPSNVDPRSGEIVESHINWYHNIISMLRDMYLIQGGALDERARTLVMDERLMGTLIRHACAHEVGHALGLRHNYGASATVPLERLRDNNWLSMNGISPSIMDYSRFNYVAQPGDHLNLENLVSRIGAYDKWAIEWGYKWFPEQSGQAVETNTLAGMANKRLSENSLLRFGSEFDQNDPRNQAEDLGDDPSGAASYGIANLSRIFPQFISWTVKGNGSVEDGKRIYGKIMDQYSRYCAQVTRNFGGTYTDQFSEKTMRYMPVDKNRILQSMDFLDSAVFHIPTWLNNPQLISSLGVDPFARMATIQQKVLSSITDAVCLDIMIAQNRSGPEGTMPPQVFIERLARGIFSESLTGMPITPDRAELQTELVRTFLAMAAQPVAMSDQPLRYGAVQSVLGKKGLACIVELIRSSKTTATVNGMHLHDILEMIAAKK